VDGWSEQWADEFTGHTLPQHWEPITSIHADLADHMPLRPALALQHAALAAICTAKPEHRFDQKICGDSRYLRRLCIGSGEKLHT